MVSSRVEKGFQSFMFPVRNIPNESEQSVQKIQKHLKLSFMMPSRLRMAFYAIMSCYRAVTSINISHSNALEITQHKDKFHF